MKKEKFKPLSDYEYDSLWMSYRYAIGRHTIAAHMHASDIAQYSVDRLSPDQKKIVARDINDCIYEHIRFSFFKIDMFNPETMLPLDIFYEFINEEKIKSYEELKKYKSVTAIYNKEENKWTYKRVLYNDDEQTRYISSMDFEDLEIWETLVKLIREDLHKIARMENPDTSEITKEVYYDVYNRTSTPDNPYIYYKKYKRPVNDKQISMHVYLNDDYIID